MLQVTSSNLQVTSSNPRVTSSAPRVTSSNPRDRRLKTQVVRLKIRVEVIKPRVQNIKFHELQKILTFFIYANFGAGEFKPHTKPQPHGTGEFKPHTKQSRNIHIFTIIWPWKSLCDNYITILF